MADQKFMQVEVPEQVADSFVEKVVGHFNDNGLDEYQALFLLAYASTTVTRRFTPEARAKIREALLSTIVDLESALDATEAELAAAESGKQPKDAASVRESNAGVSVR